METGIIFDIKEFSIFDGPGIRQTVFLKGCPLRCNWCHNPEGLSREPQIMVSLNACLHCGRCKAVCRHPDACIACGRCVEVCPQNVRRIAGTRMTSGELAETLRKDASYYAACGGGVTFSGGEPLLQRGFLAETLDQLAGIHRAVETSGYTEPEVFEKILDRVDFVMMDLKLMDEEQHKKYTGVSNRKILHNARTLMRSGKPCRLRVPLIPGVSDTEENLRATAEFIRSVEPKTPVELLPYHKTAGAKYAMVGAEYRPIFDTEKKVRTYPELFENYGLECSVL